MEIFLKAFLKHWPHGLAGGAGIAMVIKFMQVASPSFADFGIGITSIITALVGKAVWDNKVDRSNNV